MTEKQYKNIKEVSKLLNIKEHVIRYWDSIDPKTEKIRIQGLSTRNRGGVRYFNTENINKLEQVIGRGIRNCSHVMLNEKDRNITIYLHTSFFDDKESIETYLYRRCEKKAFEIGNIELILKQIAIDKYLFRNANLISDKDTKEIKINPSHRDEVEIDVNPYDKDGEHSRSCSFLENCN